MTDQLTAVSEKPNNRPDTTNRTMLTLARKAGLFISHSHYNKVTLYEMGDPGVINIEEKPIAFGPATRIKTLRFLESKIEGI